MSEFEIEFDLDEVSLDIEKKEEVDLGLPPIYLYIENLVMIKQVKGLVEDGTDLVTVPAYAEKNGAPALVGIVELTSENVLTMKQLGLNVSLIREGKDSILFDKADDYVAIVKTLRGEDTVDIDYNNISSDNGELHERQA